MIAGITGHITGQIAGQQPQLHTSTDPAPSEAAPPPGASAAQPSPGLGSRHYAPNARLALVRGQAELAREIARHDSTRLGVMLPDGWDPGAAAVVFRWGPWDRADILARLLFTGLRMMDARGVEVIVCPVPPMDGLGEALRDRLSRAALAGQPV
jgi:L-threonylcarbamoyladenylate synthase